MTTIIHLHPEISIEEITKLATSWGLRIAEGTDGRLYLEPAPQLRLPNGARYRGSNDTDVRDTIARARADWRGQQSPPRRL